MNSSHLADSANLGGALQSRHSAHHTPIEATSFVRSERLGNRLRRLILIGLGLCLLTAVHSFAAPAVILAWDANPEVDIANYRLSYGTSTGSYPIVIDAGQNLEVSVPNLVEGITYYFAVSAVNTAGLQSRYSTEFQYYVDFAVPSPNGWTLMYADSEDFIGHSAPHAFDGDPNTFWHTTWRNSSAPPPHEIQINLGTNQAMNGFRYLPRQDEWLSGSVGQYEFYVSADGVNWGSPVASGSFPCTHDLKEVRFAATSGQYIRFRGLTDSNGGPYMSVAELGLIQDSTPSVTNQAPIASPSNLTTPEDTSLALYLQGTDANGDTLIFSVVSAPLNGVLSGTAPNLIYTPSANYNGTDSFTFVVNDGTVNSGLATVSITVTPVNDAPIALSKSVVTAEDSPLPITLGGTDVEGSPLTYTLLGGPANGTLGGTAPNLTYQPAANFNGSDAFTFRVNDGTVDSAPATISIIVTPVNDAPLATSKSVTTDEDTQLPIILGGTDPDADSLSFAVLAAPTHGTLTGTAPNMTYSPAANFNGADQFTFLVNDGTINSAPATVSITVTPVNDAPIALSKSVVTAEDSPLPITLGGTDVEGSPLTYTLLGGPANGTLGGTAPNLTYQPAANFNGSDAFTFRVNDGTVDSAPATVSITVTAVNDAPVALSSSVTTEQDIPLPITLAGTDVEGSPLTFTVVSGPANGTLGGTVPNLTYQPATGFSGNDAFAFQVNDGTTTSPTATVSITVSQKLLPNNVSKLSKTGWALKYVDSEQTPESPGTSAFDSNTGTFWQTQNSAGSSALPHEIQINLGSVQNIGGFQYLPRQDLSTVGYIGNYEFYVSLDGVTWGSPVATGTFANSMAEKLVIFTAKTGQFVRLRALTEVNGGTSTSVAELNILQAIVVNQSPLATPLTLTTAKDTPVQLVLGGSDPEGSALSYSIANGPLHGTLSGTAPNLTYLPNSGFVGSDQFTFQTNDGTVSSATATVSISVTPVVDVPANAAPGFTTNPISLTATEDASFAGQLLASDANAGDVLTFRKVSGPAWLTVSTAGELGGTPLNADVGTGSFMVSVSDPSNATATATLTITVANTNDAPVFTVKPLVYPAGTEKGPYLGQSIAATATDPDAGDTIAYSKVDGPAWLVIAKSGALSGTPPSGSAGTNLFTVRATDTAGASDDTILQIKINANTLPLPWSLDRVGSGNIAGAATYSASVFTVAGAGGMALTEDSGSLGWQTLSGAGSITARLSVLSNTGTSARIGVMIRESLAANSRQLFIGVDGTGKYQWIRRLTTAGSASKTSKTAVASAAIWVRLVRASNVVTAYQSTDGSTWTKIGSSTVTLPSNCYVGLWVSSGDKGLLNSSRFTNVVITP